MTPTAGDIVGGDLDSHRHRGIAPASAAHASNASIPIPTAITSFHAESRGCGGYESHCGYFGGRWAWRGMRGWGFMA
jgi:hypothetical protein